jgi:alpha-beta hydrolase superfamily lysophospholipase
MWRHRKLTACLLLLFLFLLLNLVAYLHAHAMTHFVRDGSRTKPPESLSFWQKVKVLATGVTIPRPCNETTPARLGLPFTTHSFPAGDGIELEAWHIAHPRPRGLVVMFHGYAACKASLLGEAKAFYKLGYAIFLVDFRGSGGSSGSVTTIGVSEAEDVARTLEWVRAKWAGRPVILYGQSMGSAAILRAIAEHGARPDAVVLECPFDKLLSTVKNRFSAMGLPSFPFAQLLVFWGGVQHGFNGFNHNPVEYAEHVRCPVLLLQGGEDPRVTTEQAEAIFANLRGEKEFQLFPGVGHESYGAARPELWNLTVARFLARHLGGKGTAKP